MAEGRFLGSDLRDRFEGAARFIRGLGRSIPELGDAPDLALLVTLHSDIDAALEQAVLGLRAQGLTWRLIGQAMGVSEQAAHKRWGKRSA